MSRTRSAARKPKPIIIALAANITTTVTPTINTTQTTGTVRRSKRLLQSKTNSSHHSIGVRKNIQNNKCSKPSTDIATATPICKPPRRSQRLLKSTVKSTYRSSSSGSRENDQNKPDTTTLTVRRRSQRLLPPPDTTTPTVHRKSQRLSQPPDITFTSVLRRSQRILQAKTGTLSRYGDVNMQQSCGLLKKSSVRKSGKSISPNIEAVRLNFDDVGNVKNDDTIGSIGGSSKRRITRKLSTSVAAQTGRGESEMKIADNDVGVQQGRDSTSLQSLAANFGKSIQKDAKARKRSVAEMEGTCRDLDSPLTSGLEKRCLRTSKCNKGIGVKRKQKPSDLDFQGRYSMALPSLTVNSGESKQEGDKSTKRFAAELEGSCSEFDSPLVSELEKKYRRRTFKDNKGVGVRKKKKQSDDVFQGTENGWTKKQENALQKAYFAAKPTPNFWKRVAKLVPGKSAQECFDKVNSENLTPRVQPPRSRSKQKILSPQLEISFSETELSAEPKSKRVSRRKCHNGQKMVRHLMRKNSHVEPDKKADLFSILEPTVNPLPSSPILLTPTGITEKGSSSSYRSRSLSSQKKSKSRFSGKSVIPIASPPVLKPVKNMALHDKYVDQLHAREAKRRRLALHKGDVTDPLLPSKDVIQAAKESLISDARDAINKFRHSEIYMENSDDSREDYDDEEEDDENAL